MDFWYDVIDWLGGYPYEYATIQKVIRFVEPLGFCSTLVIQPARIDRLQRICL